MTVEFSSNVKMRDCASLWLWCDMLSVVFCSICFKR